MKVTTVCAGAVCASALATMLSTLHRIAQGFRINPGSYIYLEPWGGQQRRVLAIKGKTSGYKPRDLFIVGPFCLLGPRRRRVPVPWHSPGSRQKSPVSRHAAAALKKYYLLQVRKSVLFPTPLDNVIPLAHNHGNWTLACRHASQGVVALARLVHAPMC
jgi:hypothetical protein